jgi:rRNA processing protein Krr1/Pno1
MRRAWAVHATVRVTHDTIGVLFGYVASGEARRIVVMLVLGGDRDSAVWGFRER